MPSYFADLHVHIGRTTEGKAVKVTASRKLTFANIIEECLRRKGIDIVGIVDCASPGVLRDIGRLLAEGHLLELDEGGLLHEERVLVLTGAEIECVEDTGGVSHHIAWFPRLSGMREFSKIMSRYISNIELSSQRCGLPVRELLALVKGIGGNLVPAHAFTPHKSIYGRVVRRLFDLFPEEEAREIFSLELGLSADTYLADRIGELAGITYLSNSDAHSLSRIGREYNILELPRANFQEVVLALHNRAGRRILGNFGLDPRLGKYHRSFCASCNLVATLPPPVLSCERCGRSEDGFVKGVLDRIAEIQDYPEPRHPPFRPPYRYQIPLEFVPGLSPMLLDRLIAHFGSEMAVLHTASSEELRRAAGRETAEAIILARDGKLELFCGGGGRYGRVTGVAKRDEQLCFDFG